MMRLRTATGKTPARDPRVAASTVDRFLFRRHRSPVVTLSAFDLGKLKIAAHAREELERVGISFESIHCRSGGTATPERTARLVLTVNGTPAHVDLSAEEVEECEAIVAGETWRKIARLIEDLR